MSDNDINIHFKDLILKEKKQLELLIASKPIADMDCWLYDIILECKNTSNRSLQLLVECASNTIHYKKDLDIVKEMLLYKTFFEKYIRYVTPWRTYKYCNDDLRKIEQRININSAQKLQTYMDPRYSTIIYENYPKVLLNFNLIPLDLLSSELQVYRNSQEAQIRLSPFETHDLFNMRTTISYPNNIPSFIDSILDSIDFKFNSFIEQYDKANHTIEYASNKSISYLCLAYLRCLYESVLHDTRTFSRNRGKYEDSLYSNEDCGCEYSNECDCEHVKGDSFYLDEYEATKQNSIKLYTGLIYDFNKGEECYDW